MWLKLHCHDFCMDFSIAKPCRKNVVLMLEILRTGFSRGINAACSGMLVQDVFFFRSSVVTSFLHAYHIFHCF